MEKMESSTTPREIALMVLKVLRDIENDGERDPDKDGSSIVEAQYFFNTFNSVMARKRDTEFIRSLAEKATDMIEDDKLNKDVLR